MLLEIEYKIGRQDKVYALVRNFPGLDAEITEADLRKMAAQLSLAADKVCVINNKKEKYS